MPRSPSRSAIPSDGPDARGSATRHGRHSHRSRRERPTPPPDSNSSANGASASSSSNSQETSSSTSRRSGRPVRPREWAMIPYQNQTVQPSSSSGRSEETLVVEAPALPNPPDSQRHHYSHSREYYGDGSERRRRSRSRRRDRSYSRRHDHSRSTEQGHPYIQQTNYLPLPGRYNTDLEDQAGWMTSGSYRSDGDDHLYEASWPAEPWQESSSPAVVTMRHGRRGLQTVVQGHSCNIITVNPAPMVSSRRRRR